MTANPVKAFVLAVDPGDKSCGIVVRRVDRLPGSAELVQHWVVLDGTRPGVARRGSDVVHVPFLDEVRATLQTAGRVASSLATHYRVPVWTGLETATAPTGQVRAKTGERRGVHPTNFGALCVCVGVALAELLGLVDYDLDRVVTMPKRHNGDGALASYPLQLMSDRERSLLAKNPGMVAGDGTDERHARAAWDVSERVWQEQQLRSRTL